MGKNRRAIQSRSAVGPHGTAGDIVLNGRQSSGRGILPHDFVSTDPETNCWLCGRMAVDVCHDREPKARLNLELPMPDRTNPQLWFLPHRFEQDEGFDPGLCWCGRDEEFPLHGVGTRRDVNMLEVAQTIRRHEDGEEVADMIVTWAKTLRGEVNRAVVAQQFIDRVQENGDRMEQDRAEQRDEPDEEERLNEAARKALAELNEFQLRWAAGVRANGLVRPGTLMQEVFDRIAEGGRAVAETEAAQNAYGYGEIRCGLGAAEAKADGPTTAERIEDLQGWWCQVAYTDIGMVAEKAVTYGSNSLEQLGRKMAQLNGRRDVPKEEALELGCWVYLIGKAERWTDAVMRGERPKDDTLTDIVAYAMMARRIRAAGGWPDGQA